MKKIYKEKRGIYVKKWPAGREGNQRAIQEGSG
jgi:hypothetical protein